MAEPSKHRPRLCSACAKAADVVEAICPRDGQLSEYQSRLLAAVTAVLLADRAAFNVIRRYVALLHPAVSIPLFLMPGGQHVSVSQDGNTVTVQ